MIVGLVLLACEMITPGTFFFMFLGISGLLTGLVFWIARIFRVGRPGCSSPFSRPSRWRTSASR